MKTTEEPPSTLIVSCSMYLMMTKRNKCKKKNLEHKHEIVMRKIE